MRQAFIVAYRRVGTFNNNSKPVLTPGSTAMAEKIQHAPKRATYRAGSDTYANLEERTLGKVMVNGLLMSLGGDVE